MKTLDEVIESITKQSGLEIRNVKKPDKDRFWVDRETYNDALQYLRWYKELASDSEEFAKWKENNALTWDELRTMEGKPVWVIESTLDFDDIEIKRTGHWYIIKRIYQEQIVFNEGMSYHKSWQGIGWQAFRKERK